MFEDYGPQDRSLRAADADRESVAEFLREQHVGGRLDTDELQERLGRCFAARTYAELDSMVADLPIHQPRPVARRRVPSLALLPLIAVLFAALALSHGHLVWLVAPLMFCFLVGAGRRHGRYGAI
jgi:Domain of unknown function (DUF1707)